MMTTDRHFLERRIREDLSLRRGQLRQERQEEAGSALERWSSEGVRLHWERLEDGSVLARDFHSSWERLRATKSEALESRAFEERLRGWAASAQTRGVELDVLIRLHAQELCAGPVDAPVFDSRRWVQLELRARAQQKSALRELTFGSVEALLAEDLQPAVEEVIARVLLKQTEVAAPQGPMTVVLPSGSDAGVFFHELCGHPLEGDVVIRNASYLARRLGEVVAPDFVTVVDGSLSGPGAVSFAVDDEGEPAREVKLIDHGRVANPLTNRRTAERLGVPSNGHGRRTSYRDTALPRMTHTALRPHRGNAEEILAGVEQGLWVSFLTPRSVHLLEGDFSFQIAEARLIRDGQLGAFVSPAALEGNGLRALGGIEAVGADSAAFFGLKGCGKLDQGGLPVSFGLPTLRISGLNVRPL